VSRKRPDIAVHFADKTLTDRRHHRGADQERQLDQER
jgi:hypothetical protein